MNWWKLEDGYHAWDVVLISDSICQKCEIECRSISEREASIKQLFTENSETAVFIGFFSHASQSYV